MLEKELEYYSKHKEEILKQYRGQYVVIKGDKLIGAFSGEEQALEGGLKEFGNVAFLIKRALDEEEVVRFPALSVGVVNADIQ